MRKLFLSIVLLILFAVSAAATTLTVSSYSVPNVQYSNGSVVTLRIYVTGGTFTTSDGRILRVSQVGSSVIYQSVACSYNFSTKVVTIPSFTIDTTSDALVGAAAATYTAIFYVGGTQKEYWLSNFRVPLSLAPSSTWPLIVGVNAAPAQRPAPLAYATVDYVNNAIRALGPAAVATTTTEGTAKLSVNPADSTHPITVGDNDPRVNEDYNASSFSSLAVAVAAMPGGGATLVVNTSMSAAGVTIPAYVQLKMTGRAQLTGSGTVTIVGDFEAPKNKRVFASGLTASFSGNKSAPEFYPQWWGATGDGVTDDTTALQAGMTAAVSVNAGTIRVPAGTYRYTSLGLSNNVLHSISLIGVGSASGGTIFDWIGTGTGFKTNFSSFSSIERIYFHGNNSGIGALFTGPNAGTNSHGMRVVNCIFQDFDYGVSVGESSHAASEIVFESCVFDSNDVDGVLIANGNTISISFRDGSYTANGSYGLEDAGSGTMITINGGGASGNVIADFKFISGLGTYVVRNVRTEMAGANSLFILGGNGPNVTVESCSVSTQQALAGAIIVSDGNVHIKGFTATAANNPIYIFGDNEGAGQRPSGVVTQVVIEDSNYHSSLSSPLLVAGANGTIAGLTYTLKNNQAWSGGLFVRKDPDETGIVAPWPTLTAIKRAGAATAATPVSPAQITSNQNNYSLGTGTAGVSKNVRLSSDTSRNITGFVTTPVQVDGQEHILWNVGTQDIVLKHQDASSTAANRILSTTGADLTITANRAALLFYDSTTVRWRATLLP